MADRAGCSQDAEQLKKKDTIRDNLTVIRYMWEWCNDGKKDPKICDLLGIPPTRLSEFILHSHEKIPSNGLKIKNGDFVQDSRCDAGIFTGDVRLELEKYQGKHCLCKKNFDSCKKISKSTNSKNSNHVEICQKIYSCSDYEPMREYDTEYWNVFYDHIYVRKGAGAKKKREAGEKEKNGNAARQKIEEQHLFETFENMKKAYFKKEYLYTRGLLGEDIGKSIPEKYRNFIRIYTYLEKNRTLPKGEIELFDGLMESLKSVDIYVLKKNSEQSLQRLENLLTELGKVYTRAKTIYDYKKLS